MSLNRITNFVGIDMSKHWFNVCVLRADHPPFEFQCDNNDIGISDFIKKLKSRKIPLTKSTIVTVEHTGFYTRLLVDHLSKQNVLLVVEMALRIRKGLGLTRGKKDSLDCRRIAEYTMRHLDNLYLYVKKSKPLYTVIQLLKSRSRLVKVRGILQSPMQETKPYTSISEHKLIFSSSKNVLKSIEESIENIMTEVDVIASSDTIISRQVELLQTIPGIGKLTAIDLVCHTNCFGNCDNVKQLASYCGIAPFEVSSGTSIPHAHTSKMSNHILKGHLMMAALTQVRCRNELHDYYERKVAEGKPKNSVLNAVANKILHRVWAVIQRDSGYTAIPRRKKFLALTGLS